MQKKISRLERLLDLVQKNNELGLVKEYRFHPTRLWRFDFADVKNKIAIELEGGIWIKGRHTRGTGYKADTYKYNAATILGWKVLRYCDIKDIRKNFINDYFNLINI